MDSNHASGRPAGPVGHPSADEARLALSELDQDVARLAHSAVAPWWYHVSLGAIAALVIGAQAFPGGTGSPFIVLGVLALVILTTTYGRRSHMSLRRPAGSRSRWLVVMVSVVLFSAFVSVLVMKLAGLPQGWALVPALIAGLATVAFGRIYDVVQRQEIVGRGRAGR
ncbi:hypothetical protein AVL63_06155 [Nesterenkonia jeotgali]|uniref:Uncharacterized protein n=1 Tax=Nesterenkonia jeotgali TaxID=317018 RepID=A0A0W8IDL6_9MICC|nr:hypothetical protein AVL63_06155 [Nesterenkonia jeotgali]